MAFFYSDAQNSYLCRRNEEEFDKKAEAYFKKVYPKREIIGIDATTVIRQGGSLHCISKQEN